MSERLYSIYPCEKIADEIRGILLGLSTKEVEEVLASILVDYLPDCKEGEPKYLQLNLESEPHIRFVDRT
jgi:hypothetical protein